MILAEPKTKPTKESVTAFINGIGDEEKRRDAFALVALMKEVTKEEPVMWGTGIIGFGTYHHEYASGREGDWPIAAFSPRKQNLTVYLVPGFEKDGELLAKLGKHTSSKTCLYIKHLDDVHLPTLKTLIRKSVKAAPSLSSARR